ncbi:hypothetical protein [Streptomyces swartbergensis]|uniref:hypothetical protein n=1 Tax=Streptomyces swartbergensis TaxID=487165 RepID=UPI001FC98246|nr:hypothetical protein [Streptomyces swartbergensis]
MGLTAAVALLGLPVAGAAAQPPGRDAPDIALVVNSEGGTTAMRSGESRFARLWQLLQPTYTGTEQVSGAWVKGGYPPVRITVVWGLTGTGSRPQTGGQAGGGMVLHQHDQLFLAKDGTPWVRSDPAPEVEDDDIRWHRAPRTIYRQMDRAGLLGEPVKRVAGVLPVSGGTTGDRSAADGSGLAEGGVWWAAGGLLLGLGGSHAIRRAAARREAGPPPREESLHELIDLGALTSVSASRSRSR